MSTDDTNANESGRSDPNERDRESVFSTRSLEEIHQEIRETYVRDERPWVIGYSGGKDSTTALQLIWHALSELEEDQLTKTVHVISSDTLVETPKIVNHITSTLENVDKYAEEAGLPFEAHKVYPEVDDSFWVNLIGRGYPAPNQNFRWCTDRLKIDPADRFIEETISEHGEAVVILGARKSESATREQVMNLNSIDGSVLSRHSKFSSAYIYTPIEDFLVDDVWDYLLQVECPWGKSNRDLAALYQEADDECPMVIDTSTPSCGNSRFGCWTCTVVSDDKAMEGMIDAGNEWMEPLLEFRDMLKSTQDPDEKSTYREMKGRRYGKVKPKTNGAEGEIIPRAYKLEFRKDLLRRLLETEKEVNERRSDDQEYLELIRDPELKEIRRLWRNEESDWEDSVPQIYEDVMGDSLDWVDDDLDSFSKEEEEVLRKVAAEEDIPPKLLKRLLDTELQHHGMKRRASIYGQIDSILKEDWRTKEEILDEYENEDSDSWVYDVAYEEL
ncbi:DNA phosphorothioation system sulfurtransferase DndC [Haloarcula sp. S1AR25-5A]|uniref:DNA phosphorothioation system sulfurtransferase DndC n=1 Tax=Haloarcula terrestris TaxID=2950533 RepID=A0AAE4JKL0_9EURY|nr:DNA phosphorothioation system sulfurtransferase DndC [Haloarcula terrestris]MDS0223459.1 DNA phosphorothioation system sulfurtransferase DndC [Haloarcula terrestris]